MYTHIYVLMYRRPSIIIYQSRPNHVSTYLEADGREVVDALVRGALVDHLALRQEHEGIEELEDRVARLYRVKVVVGERGEGGGCRD